MVFVAYVWHFGQLGDERNSEIALGIPQVAQMRQYICVIGSFYCCEIPTMQILLLLLGSEFPYLPTTPLDLTHLPTDPRWRVRKRVGLATYPAPQSARLPSLSSRTGFCKRLLR